MFLLSFSIAKTCSKLPMHYSRSGQHVDRDRPVDRA